MPLKLSEFKTREVIGTTSSTADTQALFRHSAPHEAQAPTGWQITYGDVYIPFEGAGGSVVDVRSRLVSQKFSILFFY